MQREDTQYQDLVERLANEAPTVGLDNFTAEDLMINAEFVYNQVTKTQKEF